MKARKITILALGLMLSAFVAGNSVLGAMLGGCGCNPSEATCRGGGGAEAACGIPGCAPAQGGICGDNSCQGPGCGDEGCFFKSCDPYFKDLCETCSGCRVKVEAGVLILHRPTPGTQTVLLDPASGASLFDESRQELNFTAGPRIAVTVLDCEGWGFEVNYFGIDNWSASGNVANSSMPNGTANLIVDAINQVSLSSAQFQSIARMNSVEVNFRKPLFGSISCLAGFRWVELADRYSADGISAITGNSVSEMITTHNNLYGFQIGADGVLCQEADRWRITGFVKGGIYLNDAAQATSFTDPGELGAYNLNNNQLVASFFGETGVVGYAQVTKHVALSGGYQIMFANGVAQPANQLSGMNFANSMVTVDTSSGLFYHGATAGLEIAW
jgi:hypothetical protein